MAAASFVSSPCGWMTSRWGQTVAQSQNVLCARLRGWDTLRDEMLLAVPVGTNTGSSNGWSVFVNGSAKSSRIGSVP